jgi:phenylalanyl-tRNA synthetase alpha chain
VYKLTEEGKEYLKNGLPEKQLLKFLGDGKPMAEVVKFPKSLIAVGWAKKNGWITIEAGTAKPTENGHKALNEKNEAERSLEGIEKGEIVEGEIIKTLMNRNLIEESKEMQAAPVQEAHHLSLWQRILSIFSSRKNESTSMAKPTLFSSGDIAQLTPEMIKTGEWKNRNFRKYNVKTPAPIIYPGKKQPYVQFIEGIREKLIGLGFQEMKGPMVETFFWNCDALFMPQDHPARSSHDVLILKNPQIGTLPDENIVAKVKATHEGGWITESTGWGGVWSREDASKLLLRSQTTSVSARTLSVNKDAHSKYFTIDRNFRSDVIDAKHLPEFDHCEGIVVGDDLTLRHLLGYLREIANTVGAKEIKFKPSYFPFTEPSVEMYANFPKFGWVEVGGAGMMRPEVLKPLGVEKSQVLAWGLGIGRLAMLSMGISDIRMLYSDDIDWLRKAPMVK